MQTLPPSMEMISLSITHRNGGEARRIDSSLNSFLAVELEQASGAGRGSHVIDNPKPRTKCVSVEIESNVFDDEHTHVRTATISSRNSARLTIPEGPSIACNTAKAIEWDAVRLNNVDPSSRAALGVHLSPYDKRVVAGNVGMVHSEVGGDVRSMMEVSAADWQSESSICFSMDGSTAPASFCKLY